MTHLILFYFSDRDVLSLSRHVVHFTNDDREAFACNLFCRDFANIICARESILTCMRFDWPSKALGHFDRHTATERENEKERERERESAPWEATVSLLMMSTFRDGSHDNSIAFHFKLSNLGS